MRGLLEVVTSQTLGGTRHLTPPPTLGLSRHSLVSAYSGPYAECITASSSIRSLAHPLLQIRDATVAEMSHDVSGHVTHRNNVVDGGDVTEDANQNPVSPLRGPRDREQPLSKGSDLKRQVAPCSPHCSPPMTRSTWDRKPRPVSPLHVQISPVTSRNQRRPLSPTSPILQRLPKAPRPPRDCYSARAVPGEEEEEEAGEQSSESGSWGSSWEEVEEEEEVVASPETAREAEAGVQEPYHPDKGRVRLDECRVRLDECPVRLDEGRVRMDKGRVRLDECRVRMDECPVRPGEGPVIVQERRVHLFDQHIDPTYLTPETVREADAAAHERHHLDEGRVRMDEGCVRMDEGPVRLGEGPVVVQERRVHLSDQHIDPTYLTPETVREADAAAHERHHLDEGRVRMDEGCVRMDEGPVRLGEGPVIVQEGQVYLSDPHIDPTYLTPETVREADASAHERYHLDEGCVRMDEGRVRMDEGPLRLGEGPVDIQEDRVHLYDLPDLHSDHTYLTLV